MSEHTITITLTEDGRHAIPHGMNQVLAIGDTVRYVTSPPDRAFRVEFAASPFSSEPTLDITDSYPRTVSERGTFRARCFIEGPDGVMVGWQPGEEPESGGEHDVRP